MRVEDRRRTAFSASSGAPCGAAPTSMLRVTCTGPAGVSTGYDLGDLVGARTHEHGHPLVTPVAGQEIGHGSPCPHSAHLLSPELPAPLGPLSTPQRGRGTDLWPPSEINVTPPVDDHGVSTQLRLVDTTDLTVRPDGAPQRAQKRAQKPAQEPAQKPAQKRTPMRGRVTPRGGARGGSAKRSVRWAGDLRLDDRTRTVGRAGIAAAREALERVAAEQDRARSEREGRGQKAS